VVSRAGAWLAREDTRTVREVFVDTLARWFVFGAVALALVVAVRIA
jgi:hypothetical protein